MSRPLRSLALATAAAAIATSAAHADGGSHITAVWANDGGDKVVQEDCRSAAGKNVRNSVWDGSRVKLFGARNEVVAFNLVLESSGARSQDVRVSFSKLVGPRGSVISSVPTDGDGVYDWTQRNIELFYVRYLKIEGLSGISYGTYDERHIPSGLQRPWTADGIGTGTWKDRPNADKSYPDIAVPYEIVKTFNIEKGQNQSIWSDIYIPRFATPGLYRGVLSVFEGNRKTIDVPVELLVRNFSLPETPTSKTMLIVGYEDLVPRYFGRTRLKEGSDNDKMMKLIRDRHFQIAHRHKISVIDRDPGTSAWSYDSPRPEWMSRLNGSLFTPINGYEGPGAYVGNNVFSIGTYGSWGWKQEDDEGVMHQHADAWVKWFKTYAPGTEYFLYLVDESTDFLETEKWAKWLHSNTGEGRAMKSFATIPLPDALASSPDLDISASWIAVGDTKVWEPAFAQAKADPSKEVYAYNGKRPASGSFATEDDGIALRELPWGQYKRGIDRWLFWESTYYEDYQNERGANDLFHDARTVGKSDKVDPVLGKIGSNYSNGDGVLFYPGTDQVFGDDSYGLHGPIASLRLKQWRRGIQDTDYLAMAAKIDPDRVNALVKSMVPKVLWENGVDNPADPTSVRTNISWPIDPDAWEAARAQLADIIERK